MTDKQMEANLKARIDDQIRLERRLAELEERVARIEATRRPQVYPIKPLTDISEMSDHYAAEDGHGYKGN